MKKIIYSLCFSFILITASAQKDSVKIVKGYELKKGRGGDWRNKERRGNIEMFKIKFFTDKLALTPTEAEEFWPIYNENKIAVQSLWKNNKDNELAMQEGLLAVRKKMAMQLKPILKSEDRINLALKLDREFVSKMRSEIMKRRPLDGNRPGGRGNNRPGGFREPQ